MGESTVALGEMGASRRSCGGLWTMVALEACMASKACTRALTADDAMAERRQSAGRRTRVRLSGRAAAEAQARGSESGKGRPWGLCSRGAFLRTDARTRRQTRRGRAHGPRHRRCPPAESALVLGFRSLASIHHQPRIPPQRPPDPWRRARRKQSSAQPPRVLTSSSLMTLTRHARRLRRATRPSTLSAMAYAPFLRLR